MGSKAKIKILQNGPYLVYGAVPLYERIIVPKGRGYEWREGRTLPQADSYALCRCGRSKNAPFCDGMHEMTGFSGRETSSRALFMERAELLKGPDLNLADDNRCAYARFCHRQGGDAWELTLRSNHAGNKEEAIHAACECPAGRLVAMEKTGHIYEPPLEPSVIIVQDPDLGVSGGIYVTGNIPIESADGQLYETRNRVMLCRCGNSRNKPFCDAMHVSVKFKDQK
ncbi:MAG: CDGSH iron-sulfur domain-containing protein [Christensenellales bacterium]